MLLHMLTAIICYAKDSKSLQRASYFSGGDYFDTLGSIIVMFTMPHCVFLTVIAYRACMLLQRRCTSTDDGAHVCHSATCGGGSPLP